MSARDEVISEMTDAIDCLCAAFNVLQRADARIDTQIEIGILITNANRVRASLREKRLDRGNAA